jgi:hypothetical protein
MNGGQFGCRHFAATTKEKGATFSRNPLFYLVGWRPCALLSIYLIDIALLKFFFVMGPKMEP